MPRSCIGLLAVLSSLLACSSDNHESSGDAASSDGGPTVSCQSDPRVDTYVANLSKASPSGQLKVALVSSDPAPPIRGTNTWTVKVTDAGGNPVANADLTVTPFMPDHGHGTTIKAAITPKGDGNYEIQPLYLFMPGVWRVTIALGKDSVEFFFCVAG
jgi:hypothetical protein